VNQKTTYTVADFWTRLGVETTANPIPPQRQSDREFAATFPSFFLNRQTTTLNNVNNFHGSQTPTAENKFIGTNRARYQNKDFDSLIDKYFVTIPRQERIQTVGQIIHQMTDQLTLMNLFYSEDASLVGNRLVGAGAQTSSTTWNAEQWTITG
jgi:ABC-type transport system substrate-binding protein